MKAAVLKQLGAAPVYTDMEDPIPNGDDQVVMQVKAAAVKNIDKLRASGTHYASYKQLPVIVGIDGVGMLEDGRYVYSPGLTGMVAEKALVNKKRITPIPDGIDLATAAALPNAVIGATMALHRSKMKKGDVVLINGATGVTGQLAVQVAKHYGASKIIVTGRNTDVLNKLRDMGAHTLISLKQEDNSIISQLKEIHATAPIDIVIDYLWGHPIELIIKSLKGGGVDMFTHKVRIVTVGEMAGSSISLESGTLRSSDIEIMGSGLGSLSMEDIQKFIGEVLPEMFNMAARGELNIDTHTEQLSDIETVWNKELGSGKRLVIEIN
ncbi:MAG: zinc-binding alcohol dehydrogenase family protein [Sphingobacteriales bacterium]|nr:MAG: zinc-binding alcohol dehydrogenase family protein [Sphingobacteriales bacterium]